VKLSLSRIPSAAATVATALLIATPTAASAETPHSAAAFRDSVGVNTHVSYYGGPYGQWTRVLDNLQSLGVTHVRDGAFGDPSWGGWLTRYNNDLKAAAARGIKFDLIMGRPNNSGGTIDQLTAAVAGPLRPAVDMLEGPNEYDISGVSAWSSPLVSYQRQLYGAVRAQPSLNGVPVIGPTIVKWGNYPIVGNLTDALDRGNIHPYAGGQTPTTTHTTSELTRETQVAGSQPTIATEAGFHNALKATTGQPPVPESVGAAYTLRTVLEHYADGVPRTYLYELLDETSEPALTKPEQHFGLLRNDFSPKPAFTALKTMLGFIGTGTPARPTDVPLKLSGDTTGIQHLLLQRGDGSVVLAMWQTASLWDVTARKSTSVPTKYVTVSVGRANTATLLWPVSSTVPKKFSMAARGTKLSVAGNNVVLVSIPASAVGATA
jgi:hypothetical protein